METIQQAFSSINTINYRQEVILQNNIKVQALCSGYSLGSSYWIFEKNT